MRAGNGFEQAGFTNAVGSHHAGDFAGLRDKVYLVQNLTLAVVQIEVLNAQHVSAPDRRL